MSDMHHYECIVPNVDINLQSGRFYIVTYIVLVETLNPALSMLHTGRG